MNISTHKTQTEYFILESGGHLKQSTLPVTPINTCMLDPAEVRLSFSGSRRDQEQGGGAGPSS